MWHRTQHDIDTQDGRSSYERRYEAWREFRREHLMSGNAMTEDDAAINQKLREFVELHLQHAKDALDVKAFLDSHSGTHVFVRAGGELYELSKNFGASYELPVVVRRATVIEA